MKKILLAGAMMLGLAFGANAQKGSVLVYGNTGLSTTSYNGSSTTSFLFNPGVGYQFNDKWTVGAELGASVASKATPSYQAGAFLRYTQTINSTFAIYEQLGVGYLHLGEAQAVGYNEKDYNPLDAAGRSSNGFYASVSLPTVFINVKNGFGVNLGFGNVNFTSMKAKGDDKSATSFGFNFGQGISIGISKNFGGKK